MIESLGIAIRHCECLSDLINAFCVPTAFQHENGAFSATRRGVTPRNRMEEHEVRLGHSPARGEMPHRFQQTIRR